MSHVTTLKTIAIKDIDALRQTIADLQAKGIDIALKEKCKARMYTDAQANSVGVCDYVISLPKSKYDIGLVKQTDGSYVPAFDEYAGQVAGQLGAACAIPNTQEGRAQHAIGQLMQTYGKNAAINQARAEGYMVESADYAKNGDLVITLAV